MTLRTWGAGSSARCAAVPLSSWAHHACARLSPGPPALLALLTKIVFLLLFAVVTLRKKKKKKHKSFCGLKGTKQEAGLCCAACGPSLIFPYIDAVAVYPMVARWLRPRPFCSLPAQGDVRAVPGGAAACQPRVCGPVQLLAAWGLHLGALRASVLTACPCLPSCAPCAAWSGLMLAAATLTAAALGLFVGSSPAVCWL